MRHAVFVFLDLIISNASIYGARRVQKASQVKEEPQAIAGILLHTHWLVLQDA